MKVRLCVKDIKSAREEAMANYLKIMIDDFMFLMKTIDKIEESEEEEE